MKDGELYAIVHCDGHAAVYREGKKTWTGDGDEVARELLNHLGVTVMHLNDDAIDGDFPDTLTEVEE